jgi:hypothetical protein
LVEKVMDGGLEVTAHQNGLGNFRTEHCVPVPTPARTELPVFEEHRFREENIYGGDESGLMTGVAQKEKVIGAKGKKTQHQKRGVNRQNTTVIATICADGTYIPPIVIFKGKHYQVRWDQENPLDAS